jgi:RNA polymerase sigma-70 factor (ECF subfamily)
MRGDMTGLDSSIGEGQFPETLWSSILSARDSRSPERRERLQKLCTQYWKPVYLFIRRSWRCGPEDAKDLTQEFFAHVLEADLVGRYDPSIGRFRNFLKASLRLFLGETYRTSKRLKRGGDKTIVTLDMEGVDDLLKNSDQITPEEAYDRGWAEGLLSDCVRSLADSLAAEGKEIYFRVYQTYELVEEGQERPTYPEIARSLGLELHDVRNYLVAARARLRELLVARVREYVANREELVKELAELQDLFKR